VQRAESLQQKQSLVWPSMCAKRVKVFGKPVANGVANTLDAFRNLPPFDKALEYLQNLIHEDLSSKRAFHLQGLHARRLGGC
jgi:hypothetical protein